MYIPVEMFTTIPIQHLPVHTLYGVLRTISFLVGGSPQTPAAKGKSMPSTRSWLLCSDSIYRERGGKHFNWNSGKVFN